MKEAKPISSYEQLSDEELIAEVQQRRREIQQPRLTFRDHLSNFAISVAGIGFGVGSAFGYFYNLKHPADGGFNKSMEGLLDREKRGGLSWGKYFKSKPEFAFNLKLSTAIFALSSLIAIPIIRGLQSNERSEDNATKHMFGKDELRRRGYIEQPEGNFVHKIEERRLQAAERAEQPETAQQSR